MRQKCIQNGRDRMTVSETKDLNPRMPEDSVCGYERIHEYCSEQNCRNEATHAYVCRYDFVMWICKPCIENFQAQKVVTYQ